MPRTKIPLATTADVLFRNDHTCCICQSPGRHVQLHHINGDPKDHSPDNLAVLCLDHHSRVSGDEGLGRRFTAEEVRRFKSSWEALVQSKRPRSSLASQRVFELKTERPDYCDAKSVDEPCCGACSSLHQSLLDYLLADQIPSTGGWGNSQTISYRHVTGNEPSPLEKAEGGIISTFLAIRSMLAVRLDPNQRRPLGAFRKAVRYLKERQAPNGGFGRRVGSRSGIEIHESVRHTALAISCLQLLDAAPLSILEGARFLSRASMVDFERDACPSIAAAATMAAMEGLLKTGWAASNLTPDEAKESGFPTWPERKTQLIRLLLDYSTTNRHSPLWPPYGGYEKQLFYTSLITLDLLIDEAQTISPTMIESVLLEILKHETDGGLPYDPTTMTPDVGISGLFASVVSRLTVSGVLTRMSTKRKIFDSAVRFYGFVQDNLRTETFMEATFCDTLAPNLLIVGCPWQHTGRRSGHLMSGR